MAGPGWMPMHGDGRRSIMDDGFMAGLAGPGIPEQSERRITGGPRWSDSSVSVVGAASVSVLGSAGAILAGARLLHLRLSLPGTVDGDAADGAVDSAEAAGVATAIPPSSITLT